MIKALVLSFLVSFSACAHSERIKMNNKLYKVFEETSIVANLNPSFLKKLHYAQVTIEDVLNTHSKYPDSHFTIYEREGKKRRISHPTLILVPNSFNFNLIKGFEYEKYKYNDSFLVKIIAQRSDLERISNIVTFLTKSPQKDPNADIHIEINNKTLYAEIPKFAGTNGEAEKKLLELLEKKKDFKGYILDLRGNSGGSDGLIFDIASILRPQSFIKYQEYKTQQLESIMSVQGFVRNLEEIVTKYPNANYEPLLNKFRKKLEQMILENFKKKIVVQDWSKELTSKKNFSPLPISILVDDGCASACELFVAVFHKDPNVKVIGIPTMGRFLYGNPTIQEVNDLILKPTNIYNDFKYTARELFGFKPDIVELNLDKQMEKAQEWINSR